MPSFRPARVPVARELTRVAAHPTTEPSEEEEPLMPASPSNELLSHLLQEPEVDPASWLRDWWQVTQGPSPEPVLAPAMPWPGIGPPEMAEIPEEGPVTEEKPPVGLEPGEEVSEAEKTTVQPVEEEGPPEEAAVPAEAEPPALEAAAEATGAAEVKEVEAAAPEGAVVPPEAPAVAEDLRAWQSEVRAVTEANIRPPVPRDPATKTAPLQARAAAVATREGRRRAGVVRDLQQTLPVTPQLPEGVPEPKPLPVPGAEAAVEAAVGKKLPPQTMPELVAWEGRRPKIKAQMPPEAGLALRPPEPPPPVGGVKEGAAKVKSVREAGKHIEEGRTAEGPLVLDVVTSPPTRRVPAPRVKKTDVAGVLAQLTASIDTDAAELLTAVRTGAYYKGALHFAFIEEGLPPLGEAKLLPEVKTAVGTTITTIRDQAGLTAADLDRAAKVAQGVIVEQHTGSQEAITTAEQQARDTVTKEGAASGSATAGARQAADDAIDTKAAEAAGGADPDMIRRRRDVLLRRVAERLAPEDIRYEREGEQRLRALTAVESAYTTGYQELARSVVAEQRSAEQAVSFGLPLPPETTKRPVETWAIAQLAALRKDFAALRETVATTTQQYRDGIASARERARHLLYEWADQEIGDRVGFWERLWEKFKSWMEVAHNDTEVWEAARNAELGAELRGDLAFVTSLPEKIRSTEDLKAMVASGSLSAAQLAIVQSYFSKEGQGNPILAVAAGMRVRIREAKTPQLVAALNELLYACPPDQWSPVAFVAQSEGGGVNIEKRGQQLHNAADYGPLGAGTDEEGMYQALAGLTKLQRFALDLWYQAIKGMTVDEELEDELSDSELDRARALNRGDLIASDAAALHYALATPYPDKSQVWRVLRNKTQKEQALLEEAFQKEYGQSLQVLLAFHLRGDELTRAEALRRGDTNAADALALKIAMTTTWTGGADVEEVTKVYDQIRAEEEAKAAEQQWTTEQLREEIRKRNKGVEASYGTLKGGATGGDVSAMRQDFREHLEGAELDLALGLADHDMARVDAAKLEIERTSFIADDDVINDILESQHKRARADVSRDLEIDLQGRRELADLRGHPWTGEELKRQREAMDKEVVAQSKVEAHTYMRALERQYDSAYTTWSNRGLEDLIAKNMSGYDQKKAKDLRVQGYLEPEQEIYYAVQGAGTDVPKLKEVLAGKKPEEVKAIREAWATRYPDQPPLDERIQEDVSGRDTFDMELLLEGEPQTPQERLGRAKRKLRYEQHAYALGGAFSESERKHMEEEAARLERLQKSMETAEPGSAEAAYLKWAFDQQEQTFEATVEAHRRSVDKLADTVAMIASVVVAIAVGVLTAGAGLVVAAGLAAAAAAEATILSKVLLKGAAYSEEELLVDVVTGVVDVVVSVATAGVGTALLRTAKAGPMSLVGRMARSPALAKLAKSPSMAERVLAHGVAEGAEGLISSVPSALAGTLADERTWREGKVSSNILAGVGMGAAMGTLMGGTIGAFGGRARPEAPRMPRVEVPHVPRVDAAVATANFNAYRQLNPGADYDAFIRDLQAGLIRPDERVQRAFQRQVRDQLASGVPASQRAALADVPVDVLPEDVFRRLTRSAKGDAVTVIVDGRPRILLREGADPKVLREEGIHALQVMDPRLAPKAALLDEAQMAQWDRLPLRTKLEMYRAKLDLEIDAHHALLASLRENIDATPPGAARDALVEQLGDATTNMRNLAARLDELNGFGPLDRLRAQFGTGVLAERLEQPPRLFAKVEARRPKKPKPVVDPPRETIERQRVDPRAPRRTLRDRRGERSPLHGTESDPLPPGHQVRVIEPEWVETGTRGGVDGRFRYRIVEVVDADGRRIAVREETVVRGSRPPLWVERGSEAFRRGRAAEEASLAQTRRMAEEPGRRIVSMGRESQLGGGQGFDEVYLDLTPGKPPRIVVVEVKDFGEDWVPIEKFTAVRENVKTNLDRLRRELNKPPHKRLPSLQGLEASEVRALRRQLSLQPPPIELEIRLAPGTALGERGERAALKRLRREWRKYGGVVRVEDIDPDLAKAARVGEQLSSDPLTRARFIDVQKSLGQGRKLSPPFEPVVGEPDVFVDRRGRAGKIRSVGTAQLDSGPSIREVAAEVVKDLQRTISLPGGKPAPLRVVLDLPGVDAATRRRLELEIERLLREERLLRLHDNLIIP